MNQPGVPPNGNQFVELNGNDPGGIRQLLQNVPSDTYFVQFFMGAYIADSTGSTASLPNPYNVSVRFRVTDTANNNLYTEDFTWTYDGTNNGVFNPYVSSNFTLSAGDYYVHFETLFFGDTTNDIPSYFGPRIDAVPVPEPASLVALGTGLFGAIGLRRRRVRS